MSKCVCCDTMTRMRCTGCKKTAYCSTACQESHWAVHESVCASLSLPLLPSPDAPEPIAGHNSGDGDGSKEDAGSKASDEGKGSKFTRVSVTATGYGSDLADRVAVSLTAETRTLIVETGPESKESLVTRHTRRFEGLERLLAGYTKKNVDMRVIDLQDKEYTRVIGHVVTSYWTVELSDQTQKFDPKTRTTSMLLTAKEYRGFIMSATLAGATLSSVSMSLARKTAEACSRRAVQNAIVSARALAEGVAETLNGSVERIVSMQVGGGGSSFRERAGPQMYSSRALSSSAGRDSEKADIPPALEEIEHVESVSMVVEVSTDGDRRYKQTKK